jgi:hypothetical protein
MMEDRFLKRLRKKARKGLRGWPIATIAFYGPNLSQATKVTVGIVPSENAEVDELRDWKVNRGDIRRDPGIAWEILEFIEKHRVLSVAMTDAIIGCPHQRRNGLRRRMVSGLRVLARTRSLYGGEDQLIFVPIPATLIFPAQKLPCLARLPTRPDGLLSGRSDDPQYRLNDAFFSCEGPWILGGLQPRVHHFRLRFRGRLTTFSGSALRCRLRASPSVRAPPCAHP